MKVDMDVAMQYLVMPCRPGWSGPEDQRVRIRVNSQQQPCMRTTSVLALPTTAHQPTPADRPGYTKLPVQLLLQA